MIDQVNTGETIWYPLYSDSDIAADPTKKNAGMWYIPGDPDKPLAVIAAGGGFRSVTSLQEAFPHAQKLHEMGYNVAILKYRVTADQGQGGGQGQGQPPATAQSADPPQQDQGQGQGQGQQDPHSQDDAIQRDSDDMAALMTKIRDNADAWHVNLHDYSVWGSSAGGQLMSAWASDGPYSAKTHGFDKPAVVVDAYTPPRGFDVSATFPPSFVTVGADDTTAGAGNVDKMVDQLKADGVPVDYARYPSVGHGFGLGTGTSAAGWLDRAVAFWQQHMPS
jgi:acetyl esterase/lipase